MTEEPTPEQAWTWQEGIEYEVTLEIIGEVIGVCSQKIGDQESSADPDQDVIDAWERESRDWAARQHALHGDDPAAVAAIRDEAISRLNYLEPRAIP